MKKALAFVVLVSCFFVAEILVRLMGYYLFNYNMKVDKISDVRSILPKPYFTTDTLVGYSLKPGRYETVYESGFSFFSTHNNRGNRITKIESDSKEYINSKRIYIYGDSYFYGFGLDDTATFGYKLQQQLDWIDVVNKSIMGHSAVSSLLLLKNYIINNQVPDIAIILFTGNDLDRCVFSKSMERNIRVHKSKLNDYSYPYARIENDNLVILYKSLGKSTFMPARYSAIINLFETTWFDLSEKNLDKQKVHRYIFNEITEMCQQNKVKLCIVSTARGDYAAQQKQAFEKQGILFVDVSDLLTDEYTLLPFDRHPNGLANSIWVERCLTKLDATLN